MVFFNVNGSFQFYEELQKNMIMKNQFSIFSALFLMIAVFAFSSCDDETPEVVDNCIPSFKSQNASGMFMGEAFTFVDGKAKVSPFDSTQYAFTFYGETPTGDMCDNFNFDLPKKTILFDLPQQVGLYELGFSTSESLTFNDATVTNQTTAEVSLCGAIEILTISTTSITGRLHAKVEADSTNNIINGNFEVMLCN